MLRYRIARDPKGRYVVLPAPTSLVSISETYGSRPEAQDTADWLNRLGDARVEEQPSRMRTR